MQTLSESIWNMDPPDGLFNKMVINNLFPDLTEAAKRELIRRSLKHKEIIRLKPGVYCLAEKYRKSNPHPFVVAGMLLSPSYISLESALWHHGLIPEALFQVSSMTSLRSRVFKNELGVYTYRRIPCNNFKAGVKSVKIKDHGWTFLAEPLRAIADMIYLNKKISWEIHGITYLTESLRIEPESLKSISYTNYNDIYLSITNKRVQRYLSQLRGVLKNV